MAFEENMTLQIAEDPVEAPAADAGWVLRERFRFPAMRPCVPEPERWLPYLQRSYEVRWFSNFGPVAHDFEIGLARRFGMPGESFTSANNCTAAIAAALIASDVTGNVAIPAFSFPATAAAVLMAGARPVVLDVDPETWVLSAEQLEDAARRQRLEAVVPVVPFGIAQDFSQLMEIASRHGLVVVIDNASGLGGPRVPLPADDCFEAYSMHATKPFAIGEGGAIRSASSQQAALRRALNFGLEHAEPVPEKWGINGKLPEVCAAIGCAVLEDFDAVIARRQRVVRSYIELLGACPQLQFVGDVSRGVWQGFPVLLPSAKAVEFFCRRAGTQGLNIRRYYRPTLEECPRITSFAPCAVARDLSDRVISLPVYSDMTDDELASVTGIAGQLLKELFP